MKNAIETPATTTVEATTAKAPVKRTRKAATTESTTKTEKVAEKKEKPAKIEKPAAEKKEKATKPVDKVEVPATTEEATPAAEVTEAPVKESKRRAKAPIGTIKQFGDRQYIQTEKGWRYHAKTVTDVLLDDRHAQFNTENGKVLAKVSQDVIKRLEAIMDSTPEDIKLFEGKDVPTIEEPLAFLGENWLLACVYYKRQQDALAAEKYNQAIYKGYFDVDGTITPLLVNASHKYNRIQWFKLLVAERYSASTVEQVKNWMDAK